MPNPATACARQQDYPVLAQPGTHHLHHVPHALTRLDSDCNWPAHRSSVGDPNEEISTLAKHDKLGTLTIGPVSPKLIFSEVAAGRSLVNTSQEMCVR